MSGFKYSVPKNWKVIDEEDYKKYSIINNEDCPCEKGYVIPNAKGGEEVVSVFKYEGVDPSFLNELKSSLDDLAKNAENVKDINEYINDNAEDYDVKGAESLLPIFYKQGVLCGKKCFINIMKITTASGTAYSMQIFIPFDKECIYCFSTSAVKIDEKDPFTSFVSENPHVKDLVNVVIESLK